MVLAWLLNSMGDIVMAGLLGGVAIYARRTRAEVRELKRSLGYGRAPAPRADPQKAYPL